MSPKINLLFPFLAAYPDVVVVVVVVVWFLVFLEMGEEDVAI